MTTRDKLIEGVTAFIVDGANARGFSCDCQLNERVLATAIVDYLITEAFMPRLVSSRPVVAVDPSEDSNTGKPATRDA